MNHAVAFTAYIVVSSVFSLMLTYAIALDVMRNKSVLVMMSKLGVPESWLPMLAALKAAGALGLLVGIGVTFVGVAGATGLVVFFLGAIVTHLRARDSVLGPTAFLVPAVSALVLRLVSM